MEGTDIPGHLDFMIQLLLKEEQAGDDAVCLNRSAPSLQPGALHGAPPATQHSKNSSDVGSGRRQLLALFWPHGLQYPNGMMKVVLRFFTNLLAKISQPLLPHVGVHGPLQVTSPMLRVAYDWRN